MQRLQPFVVSGSGYFFSKERGEGHRLVHPVSSNFPTSCDAHPAESIFQIRSGTCLKILYKKLLKTGQKLLKNVIVFITVVTELKGRNML